MLVTTCFDNNRFSGVVSLNSSDGVLPQWFSPFVNKSPVSNLFSPAFSYLVICLCYHVLLRFNWPIKANVKVEHISTKKINSMLSSQKSLNDKASLGYTNEGSSSIKPKKEVRFVSAKNVEKSKVEKPEIKTLIVAKRTIGAKPNDKGKSLPKSQRGLQVKHFCHHCGVQGHTRPNYFKLQALKKADSLRGLDNSRRMPKGIQVKGENERQLIGDVMEMLKNISSCLATFTLRFESYVGHTPLSRDLTQNTCIVWVKKGTHT